MPHAPNARCIWRLRWKGRLCIVPPCIGTQHANGGHRWHVGWHGLHLLCTKMAGWVGRISQNVEGIWRKIRFSPNKNSKFNEHESKNTNTRTFCNIQYHLLPRNSTWHGEPSPNKGGQVTTCFRLHPITMADQMVLKKGKFSTFNRLWTSGGREGFCWSTSSN